MDNKDLEKLTIEEIKEFIEACPTTHCEKHTYIPISWKLTEKSKHATQFMCQHCLLLGTSSLVAEYNDTFNKLRCRLEALEGSQKSDDN